MVFDDFFLMLLGIYGLEWVRRWEVKIWSRGISDGGGWWIVCFFGVIKFLGLGFKDFCVLFVILWLKNIVSSGLTDSILMNLIMLFILYVFFWL